MRYLKDKNNEFDELYDPNWEPTLEDFQVDKEKEPTEKPRKNWVKIVTVLIAVLLIFQVTAVFFSTYTLDAMKFLQISYRLSQQDDVQQYKQAVVTIQGDRSRGTGFAISADGLIITNHHVIENQTQIMVGFYKGELFQGEIISSYPDLDIAFLKVDGKGLPYLPLSQSNGFIKENIYVIGNPLSWSQIANEGEVLSIDEKTLISAPIYRGNSGSPVINMAGEVIAVVYAKRRTTEYGGKSVGVAVPIEKVKGLIPN